MTTWPTISRRTAATSERIMAVIGKEAMGLDN